MIALSGAKKVYMNDIDPIELGKFLQIRSTLPESVKNKLDCLSGDCFFLKSTLKENIDILLCRNFLHFLTDDQQKQFFQMIKGFLTPRAKVVFLTNSIYSDYRRSANIYEKNPKATSFKVWTCFISNYGTGVTSKNEPIWDSVQNTSSENVSKKNQVLYLYERRKFGKWTVDNRVFQSINPTIRKEIKAAIKANKHKIKPIKWGSVRILINYIRIYSVQTLPDLFRQNGFRTNQLFVVGEKGHLLKESEYTSKGRQIGIIATLESSSMQAESKRKTKKASSIDFFRN